MTHLNALYAYSLTKIQGKGPMDRWCHQAFLNQRVLEEVLGLRGQLFERVETLVGTSTEMAFGDPDYDIPQYAVADELQSSLRVVYTQPRTLAATDIAEQVVNEMDVKPGQEVGSRVCHDHRWDESTRLEYVTEGTLLSTAQVDKYFSEYIGVLACVIIDEAHEQNVNTDLLIALLKTAAVKRPELKVIIMSATINSEKFVSYFSKTSGVRGVTAFEIEGRNYPVQVLHMEKCTFDYVGTTTPLIRHIHKNKGPGDILLFVPSIAVIEAICSMLRGDLQTLRTVPLYSALSWKEQRQALASSSQRKCVVSTNIAEASVTIPGIVYVIDSGLEMQAGWNPRAGMETLTPGILREDLSKQLLLLKNMGFH
ncbi:pre-mrna splicing factor rna helicase [Fusarium albosuccineum]|uniref:Pre-mrna splicing factor rna helicase n=1 Tax=Fusarium albosuccineum TaxID=1237068 RepID=A0A8H4LP67_9HYPO|nr:pre-mrna splicing factor rna helicase [Fusarium albosuccineum]